MSKTKTKPVVRCTVVLLRSQRDALERQALKLKLKGRRDMSLSAAGLAYYLTILWYCPLAL